MSLSSLFMISLYDSKMYEYLNSFFGFLSLSVSVNGSVMLPAQNFSLFLPAKKEISMSCAIEL